MIDLKITLYVVDKVQKPRNPKSNAENTAPYRPLKLIFVFT
jgi:hypothetical protein